MDGLPTQEEINQLLSAIVDDEERVIKNEKKFHRKDTLDATLRALLGKEDVDNR